MDRKKRKVIFAILAVMMAMVSVGNISVTKAKTINNFNDYVIIMKSDSATDKLLDKYDSTMALSRSKTVKTVLTGNLTKDEVKILENDSLAVCVEPNINIHGTSSNMRKTRQKHQKIKKSEIEWNLQMVNANSRNKHKIRDNNKVKVAIIDSGIDYTTDIDVHVRKNFIPDENEIPILYEDGSGHGTSVAGIIAAKDNNEGITGVNENVELYSAKVLDADNSAPLSRVIEAIDWAIDQDVDIINMSFGTRTYSAAMKKAIERAADHGILLVAAAGNGNDVEYPAAYDKVMAVGAVGTDGLVSKKSSYGEELDVMAPGEQIMTTGAFDGVIVAGGTSMAAPHVTGIASILLQKNKNVPVEFIRELICASAKKVGDTDKYGNGIVDLRYAIDSYDDAWQAYQNNVGSAEQKVKTAVELNDEIIGCYDSINTVEGRWTKSIHEELATKGSVTGEDLYALKMGARLSDNETRYGINGMTEHPQFHGNFSNYNLNSATNYIACYLMLTKMAKQYWGTSYSTPAKVTGLLDSDYNALTTAVTKEGIGIGSKKQTWGQVLSGQRTDNRRKAMILYGMALHTATDAFCHSVFINGSRIVHNACDSKEAGDYYGNYRYNSAMYVAKKMLAHVNKKDRGYVSDFAVPQNIHGNKYKLKYISTFAKNINSTTYTNNKAVFDALNIN